MGHMTKKEYEAKLRKIKLDNENRERKYKLREEKRKYKAQFGFKLPSTSKLILAGIILLCLEIIIFCERLMIKTNDTSSMYVLLGIPVALIPIIWAYYSKSKAENTVGGIVYETVMAQMNKQNKDSCEEEQDEDTDGSEAVG